MRNKKSLVASVLAAGLVAGLVGSIPASANHNADDHSKNVRQMARKRIKIAKGLFAEGSDLAFQKRLLVAGTYQGTALYKIKRNKPFIKQVGFHQCPGAQGDVSVWGKLAFVSIDSASTNNRTSPVCNNTNNSADKEGVRIINVKNPREPRQVGFIETDCGSHTHTLVPDGRKLYIYVLSYPLGAPTATCNPASHRKISVIKVNKQNPKKSKLVTTPDVSPPIGCHDVTVFPRKNLAAAACISESQMWNIKDRKNPKIIAHVPHPEGMQISHSSAFTWDGKYVIFSDEYGGASGGGGCTGDEDSTVGAMFFYDISNPRAPVRVGHHSLPRVPPVDQDDADRTFRCTTHNYNILPVRKNRRYIAVSSYYMGGLGVVDFTEPAEATETGHYMPLKGGVLADMWSAYWYNGRVYTNENESRRGVSVFKVKGTGKYKVRFFKGRFNPQTQIPRFK